MKIICVKCVKPPLVLRKVLKFLFRKTAEQ